MARRDFATDINDTTYTKVVSNATVFTILENYVGSVRVIIQNPGDAAPSLGDGGIPLDGTFPYSGEAADVWVISPKGATTIYGLV